MKCNFCGYVNPDGKEKCEKCGKPICTGRYCDGCKSSMANNLKSAFEKPQPQAAPKKQAKDQRMRLVQND